MGLALVRDLLGRNFRVASFARSTNAEVATVCEDHPNAFLFGEVDALDDDAIRGFVREVDRWGNGIDALVNNAAMGQDHLLAHVDEETIDLILAINLRAPILITKETVKRMMLAHRPGHIVNISSICGSRGYPGLSIYSATKGALDAFTRSMARELGDRGIRVNAVAPGFFSSEMSAVLSEEQMETIRRRSATGKLTEPGQVVEVVGWLLQHETNITGQVFSVDGGASI